MLLMLLTLLDQQVRNLRLWGSTLHWRTLIHVISPVLIIYSSCYCVMRETLSILATISFFSTMLSDLRDSETDGLEISGHAVKAAGFCITGDNLGSPNTGE